MIERRFRGPANSANGGYTCGLVAGLLGIEAAEVTLRLPPPLETPLAVERDHETVRLLHGDALVAEGRPGEPRLELPEPLSYVEAARLVAALPDESDHPFPGCFVCGPAREPGDGLHLRPAPLGDGRVVAAWRALPELFAGGLPPARLAWAALDCPGGWAVTADSSRGISVLGRLTARVLTPPEPGDECVVVGWALGADDRKLYAGTALYRNDQLLAAGRAVWFAMSSDVRDDAR